MATNLQKTYKQALALVRIEKHAGIQDIYQAVSPFFHAGGHAALIAGASHLVQNQLAKGFAANKPNLALYRNSFLAGTLGHSNQSALASVRAGLSRAGAPEIGLINDHLNHFGRELEGHLQKQGLSWNNMPEHHYEYAQAVAGANGAKMKELESKHGDIQYIKQIAHQKIPGLVHASQSAELGNTWKNSMFGKILPSVLEKPSTKAVQESYKAKGSKISKYISTGSELAGNAALGYIDPVIAGFNGAKRLVGANIDAAKHPYLHKGKKVLENLMVTHPVEEAYKTGEQGKRRGLLARFTRTNVVNPVVGQAMDVANEAGLVKHLEAKRKGSPFS